MDKLQGRASFTIAVIALAVAVTSLLGKAPGAGAAPPKQAPQPLSGHHIMRVVGNSQILVTPNEAYVQLGVTGRDSAAQTALSRARGRVDATLAAIKALGVSADDIHAANAGLIYDPNRKSYQAGTLLTIELKDAAVSKAGPVVDAAVGAGATKCASVYFRLADDAAANDQVLQQALADARKQADNMAAATGVKITGMDSIDQVNYGYGGPPPSGYGGPPGAQPLFCQSPSPGPSGPFPVLIPQLALTATATVVYTIR